MQMDMFHAKEEISAHMLTQTTTHGPETANAGTMTKDKDTAHYPTQSTKRIGEIQSKTQPENIKILATPSKDSTAT